MNRTTLALLACVATSLGSAAIAAEPRAAAPSTTAAPLHRLESAKITSTDGRVIFESYCQGCHMPGGVGAVGGGRYPALAGDRLLATKEYVAMTVLLGRRNMPAFGERHAIGFLGPGATLTYAQIAGVVNYVRGTLNRWRDPITEAQVGALEPKAP
jgi:mono/diheme cytochrome c family protein